MFQPSTIIDVLQTELKLVTPNYVAVTLISTTSLKNVHTELCGSFHIADMCWAGRLTSVHTFGRAMSQSSRLSKNF